MLSGVKAPREEGRGGGGAEARRREGTAGRAYACRHGARKPRMIYGLPCLAVASHKGEEEGGGGGGK